MTVDHATLDRAGIAALIPQAGASCLLERLLRWDAGSILCASRTHLDPANPYRRAGTLGALVGIEYGLQAAALHGAMAAGGRRQPAGRVAALREVRIALTRLDDPAVGTLAVTSTLEAAEASGLAFSFCLTAEDGRFLLGGRALIALPGGRG